jgi:hypothetical protein
MNEPSADFLISESKRRCMLPRVIRFLHLQRIALAYLVVAVLEIVTKNAKIQDQSSSGFSIFRMYFSQWYAKFCFPCSHNDRLHFCMLIA